MWGKWQSWVFLNLFFPSSFLEIQSTYNTCVRNLLMKCICMKSLETRAGTTALYNIKFSLREKPVSALENDGSGKKIWVTLVERMYLLPFKHLRVSVLHTSTRIVDSCFSFNSIWSSERLYSSSSSMRAWDWTQSTVKLHYKISDLLNFLH